jgi:hypothetical protein
MIETLILFDCILTLFCAWVAIMMLRSRKTYQQHEDVLVLMSRDLTASTAYMLKALGQLQEPKKAPKKPTKKKATKRPSTPRKTKSGKA